MMKIIPIALFVFLAFGLSAQYGCDGLRYRSVVFTDVDTTFAVKFGENTTPGGANMELFMDIYEPQGDSLSNRPVIIWAFGGSFISGDRSQLSELCYESARRGYVAVAIDYRTYDGAFIPFPDSLDFVDVAVKAIGDMKASIRKLREDAANGNPYRIDPDFIIAGGVSAGGIAATHAGMLDSTDVVPSYFLNAMTANGGWEGNSSTNYQYSSEVQAVINFSGALGRAEWIDVNDPPIFSAHDDGDGTVPYGNGFAGFNLGFTTLNILYMEGSSSLHTEASDEAVYNQLITIPNSTGHVSFLNGSSPFKDSVVTSSHIFAHNVYCGIPAFTESVAAPDLNAFPNPSAGDIMIKLTELPCPYDLILFDALGREAYRVSSINTTDYLLPRNTLEAGLYFMTLKFEDKKLPLVQQKIIFR